MRDLANAKWMYLKAALFFVLLVSGCTLVLLETPTWRTAALVVLIVWSSARLYYFMFYVIERYIDPTYRFSGMGSFIRYLMGRDVDSESDPGDAESDT
jgi:hypothetical protein